MTNYIWEETEEDTLKNETEDDDEVNSLEEQIWVISETQNKPKRP